MTIRFAAANPVYNPVIARLMGASVRLRADNDNISGANDDGVLKAALRHFAQHGLGAAERAHRQAQDAFFAGDSEKYRWWMAICRTLDRRMADAAEAHCGIKRHDPEPPAGNLA